MTAIEFAIQHGPGVLAAGVTGYFTLVMWRQRREPTARPLLAVAALAFLGAVGHLVATVPNPLRQALRTSVWAGAGGPLWLGLAHLVVMLAGGFWFLFALRYTGRGGRLVPRTAAAIGLFWLAVLAVARFGEVSSPPEAPPRAAFELALMLGMYLMAVLTVVGALLVLTTSLQRNAVRFREGVALAGGAVALAFSPIAGTVLLRASAVPVLVLAAAGLFVLAVRRYPAFEAPPVARIAGRDRLIEELDDPFLVVDRADRIQDLNPAAERYFDVARADVIGESLDAVLPSDVDPAEMAATESPETVRLSAGRRLAVSANRITDARDRCFGHLLVCRDVTDRRRRERRLGLLNQLLTGAVSDRMRSVASDAADVASRGDDDRADDAVLRRTGARIRAQSTELLELVARTREVERVLAEGAAGPADVGSVVREVVADVAAGADVDPDVVTAGETAAAVDAAVLETVLELLVTDAVERGREHVEVAAVDGADGPEIRIRDDRPLADGSGEGGRDDAEREPRSVRTELRVEMARLTADHVGATVSTRVTDAGDRRATAELPAWNEPAAGTGEGVRTGAEAGSDGRVRQGGERS